MEHYINTTTRLPPLSSPVHCENHTLVTLTAGVEMKLSSDDDYNGLNEVWYALLHGSDSKCICMCVCVVTVVASRGLSFGRGEKVLVPQAEKLSYYN